MGIPISVGILLNKGESDGFRRMKLKWRESHSYGQKKPTKASVIAFFFGVWSGHIKEQVKLTFGLVSGGNYIQQPRHQKSKFQANRI